jgi:hypothetical protein
MRFVTQGHCKTRKVQRFKQRRCKDLELRGLDKIITRFLRRGCSEGSRSVQWGPEFIDYESFVTKVLIHSYPNMFTGGLAKFSPSALRAYMFLLLLAGACRADVLWISYAKTLHVGVDVVM